MRKLLVVAVLVGLGVMQSASAMQTVERDVYYVKCPACIDLAEYNADPEGYLNKKVEAGEMSRESANEVILKVQKYRSDGGDGRDDEYEFIAMIAKEGRYAIFDKLEETMNNPEKQNLAKLFRDQDFSKIQGMVESGEKDMNNIQIRFVCCGAHTTCYDADFTDCCERTPEGSIWWEEQIPGDTECSYCCAHVSLLGYCEFLQEDMEEDMGLEKDPRAIQELQRKSDAANKLLVCLKRNGA